MIIIQIDAMVRVIIEFMAMNQYVVVDITKNTQMNNRANLKFRQEDENYEDRYSK
jgi:hypothetical protein